MHDLKLDGRGRWLVGGLASFWGVVVVLNMVGS